jgi:hypothetical protein
VKHVLRTLVATYPDPVNKKQFGAGRLIGGLASEIILGPLIKTWQD